MKVKVTITVTLDGDIEEIGRQTLRDYVRDELLANRGSKRLEDPIRMIEDVTVSGITVVRNQHENQVAGGVARAKALSPERRREIAKQASAARWAK